jgi:2-iminoacetate synthase
MFSEIYDKFNWSQVENRINSSTKQELEKILGKNTLEIDDFYPLFSEKADQYLEKMALKSSNLTQRFFGKIIQLYTPIYLSNECYNSCLYCSFNAKNKINRVTLNLEEISQEADYLYQLGARHLLLVSGESRQHLPVESLAKIGKKLHEKFSALAIEIYPLETEEYLFLIESGIEGLTLYQETYHKEIYEKVHPAGPKKNFYQRLNTPDKGGLAKFKKIGLGSLLGLANWRVEGFFLALHSYYLRKKYWQSQIQISFPRLQKNFGNFQPFQEVSDHNLVHLITALRLINPTADLVISTRENTEFRKNLIPLGITMMSAGSKTSPGAYTKKNVYEKQFHLQDESSPKEIARLIKKQGYDPIWKDWDKNFIA